MQGNRFVSLADYCAMGHSEVSVKEGDTVELLKIGCAGWWYVKIISKYRNCLKEISSTQILLISRSDSQLYLLQNN